jgi:hypothetical protein
MDGGGGAPSATTEGVEVRWMNEELRALRQRWRESGALEDEVALLQARLRHFELDPETLALAAYCGHPAALAVVEPEEAPLRLGAWVALRAPPNVRTTPLPSLDWGLGRWGRDALLRALAAMIRRSLQHPDPDPRVVAVAHAFERWLLFGGDGADIEDAEQQLERVAADRAASPDGLAVLLLRRACKCSWYPVAEAVAESAALAAADLGLAEVEGAIAAELIPWALGLRDPVRERAIAAPSGLGVRAGEAEGTPEDARGHAQG